MLKSYSIAEARTHLSRLINEADTIGPVELTRHGRPVAVVLSVTDFCRLSEPRPDLLKVIQDLRAEFDMEALDIDPDSIFEPGRDCSPGRDFAW